MKKIILMIIPILLITGCNKNNNTTQSLMKSNDFSDIIIENITTLEIIEYKIDGKEIKEITNQNDILEKYNYLNNYKIGKETNITCEDNTVIYNFKENDKIITIEIECGNILVVDDKRYDLIK